MIREHMVSALSRVCVRAFSTHIDTAMTVPIRVQIVSDLHLETPLLRPRYDSFELPVSAPHLALLGDTGKANQPALFSFLQKQIDRYQTVFFLLGNHEAYRCGTEYSSYSQACKLFKDFEREVNNTHSSKGNAKRGRFVFLDRTRYDFTEANVTILGCTLFSHVPEEQRESVTLKVSDFSAFGPGSGHIDDWDITAHNAAHAEDLMWLNETVRQITQEEPGREVAIFTHHSPTTSKTANDPVHLEDYRQVNSAFVTDLSKEDCWNSTIVKLWAFGHTHFNCDFVESGFPHNGSPRPKYMRVVTNQRGYFRSDEAPGFDAEKVVSLG